MFEFLKFWKGRSTMSIETDVKAVVADVKAETEKVAGDVKSEFEKVFATAKVDAVAFEGSVSAEIVKLKAAVAAIDQSATIKALEAKVDALIAKIGAKL